MKRIAIIGGGISGLSAAYTIEKKRQSGTPVQYVLFESSPRRGGVVATERVDGCLVEAGPDSFITEKPWAADLCSKIGVSDQLIGSNDSERKTYIVTKGKLVEMPDGLMFMVPTKIVPTVMSPLFSLRTKIRMATEWFHPRRNSAEDETVAQMVERHYGAEMVELLADPLLCGIYGGDASQLSVRAVLPRLADMESKHGSLGRGMVEARKKRGTAAASPLRPVFTSLKEGMQQIVDALVARLDAYALKTSSRVQAGIPEHDGWTVSSGARATNRSYKRAEKKFCKLSATNCGRFSASMPNLCCHASTNGNSPWRSIRSATSNACSVLNLAARTSPVWRWRAMAITALASPIACAPAPKRLAKSSLRWGCGRLPSRLASLQLLAVTWVVSVRGIALVT